MSVMLERWFYPTFAAIRIAPRELWLMVILQFFVAFSQFSMSVVFVVYASKEHDFDDISAGALYGVWGLFSSMANFFFAPSIDRFGLRRSFVICGLVSSIGMLGVGLAFNKIVFVLFALFIVPIGAAFGAWTPNIGVDRFTYAANSTLFYGITYGAMNLGALVSVLSYDWLRETLAGTGGIVMSHGWYASSERLLILCGAISAAISGLLSSLCLRDIHVDRSGAVSTGVPEAPKRQPLLDYIFSVIYNMRFRRLVLFSFCLLFVRQTFQHMDSTLPKYLIRVFGSEFPIATVYGINPTLIIFLAPLLSVFTPNDKIYTAITVGTLISAGSIAFIAVDPSYPVIAMSMVGFTIGEAIYSPATNKVVMQVAPEDQKATFNALVGSPYFLARVFVGAMSGKLLFDYCPAPTQDSMEAKVRCGLIWAVIGGVALISPVLLFLLRNTIFTADMQNSVDISNDVEKASEITLRETAVDEEPNDI